MSIYPMRGRVLQIYCFFFLIEYYNYFTPEIFALANADGISLEFE